MNPRFLLPLLFLLSLPAAAQLPLHEVAASAGAWNSGEFGSGPAFGVSYNRFWTRAVSTRFGLIAGGGEGEAGEGDAQVYHVSGEYHLAREARVSPWVGAGVGLAVTSREVPEILFESSETKPALVGTAGVDFAVTPRFAIGGDVSYSHYKADLGSRFGLTVDPITAMVTGRWRF